MKYILNHPRFKKKFNQEELSKMLNNTNRLIQFPKFDKNYYNFFNDYAKKNYKLIEHHCLCKNEDDILLSLTDRHCVDYITVVCKNCGLIRAKEYFRDEDVQDFYKNFYRTKAYSESNNNRNPEDFFEEQKKNSKYKFDLLDKYKTKPLSNLKIIDLGGGVGGFLDHFNKSNEDIFLIIMKNI